MHRAPIKVCVRTRPTGNFAQGVINIDQEAQTIVVNTKGNSENAAAADIMDTGGTHDHRQSSFRFQFHHVLHNAAQEAIYDGLAREIVQSAVDGCNGTIMTYGKCLLYMAYTASRLHFIHVEKSLKSVHQMDFFLRDLRCSN
jgi:kinesin family member 6/9